MIVLKITRTFKLFISNIQKENIMIKAFQLYAYRSWTVVVEFHKLLSRCLDSPSFQHALMDDPTAIPLYRFSAFWLRSKCSICSYQLNIWYDPHVGSTILNWFLAHGEVLGACSTFAADRPGIAVPPGLVHSPRGEKKTTII